MHKTRPFIHEDFLLQTKAARHLYHQFAQAEPILDYHNHLSPRDIAENRSFKNLSEIWLEGDHYKWRAMRANGVSEEYCTGKAEPLAKFRAWASTVPDTLRNPLYHWTHLELKRYFQIDELLNESSAERVWHTANEQLSTPALSTQGILKKFQVKSLCTTDDPTDDLRYHASMRNLNPGVKVYPAFRPDKALAVNDAQSFNAWVDKLESSSNIDISSLSRFLEALEARHTFFHENGCRLSDHGLSHCSAQFCSDTEATEIFAKARHGQACSPKEHDQFTAYAMLFFGRLDSRRGWVKQLHLGALRNNNTRLRLQLGPDTGFDSIGDFPQAQALAQYLDRLDRDNALPKTILYNVNPVDNYAFAAMVGNFQDGAMAGKVQLGSAWWFLDQKEGMEWQLSALSNLGLLSRFVGMVTDSRSFMSFTRHEYFRRVLCNLIGRDVENGELPDDDELLGGMIRNICYRNACSFLDLPGSMGTQQ
jgi:glucuronate isomerase